MLGLWEFPRQRAVTCEPAWSGKPSRSPECSATAQDLEVIPEFASTSGSYKAWGAAEAAKQTGQVPGSRTG